MSINLDLLILSIKKLMLEQLKIIQNKLIDLFSAPSIAKIINHVNDKGYEK